MTNENCTPQGTLLNAPWWPQWEGNPKKRGVCVWPAHFAIQQKLTRHCKATISQQTLILTNFPCENGNGDVWHALLVLVGAGPLSKEHLDSKPSLFFYSGQREKCTGFVVKKMMWCFRDQQRPVRWMQGWDGLRRKKWAWIRVCLCAWWEETVFWDLLAVGLGIIDSPCSDRDLGWLKGTCDLASALETTANLLHATRCFHLKTTLYPRINVLM